MYIKIENRTNGSYAPYSPVFSFPFYLCSIYIPIICSMYTISILFLLSTTSSKLANPFSIYSASPPFFSYQSCHPSATAYA